VLLALLPLYQSQATIKTSDRQFGRTCDYINTEIPVQKNRSKART